MVKKTTENGKTLYVCEECGLKYVKERLAEKCEAWCRENNSCNLEITKHAIKLSAEKSRYS